jgi:hypothetical protein
MRARRYVAPPMSSTDRLAAAERACAALGLPGCWARTVADRMADPGDQGRACCGSNCDPCVETGGRAVDLARRLLRSAAER